MKRFIDLRGQHTGERFAWWDTVRGEFDSFYGAQAWCTWQEFAVSFICDSSPAALRRYMKLAPAWAFLPDPDDDHEADTADL